MRFIKVTLLRTIIWTNIPHFLHVLFEDAVLASLNYYGSVETQNEASSIGRVLPSGGLYLRLNSIVAYDCVCEAFGHKIQCLQSHLFFRCERAIRHARLC